MDLSNKVAIVTGGATGIGKAISLKLFELGAIVVVNYNSSSANANELVNYINNNGGKALAIQANIANISDTERLFDETIKTFGKVDILVNNAGITKDGLILRMKEEDFDSVIETNLKGAWNMCKQAAKVMTKQRSGKIVNISSVVGIIGNVGQSNYCASKAGVIGLTKALAKELASRNVLVNAVAPGFIKTQMTENLNEAIVNQVASNIPLGRFGEANDIANAVVFLCSDLANYITGQVLNVCGGLVMN